jgi:hypothetical protein
MKRKTFHIVVSAGDGRAFAFNFKAHRTTSAATRLIDVAFYETNTPNRRAPGGVHYEAEILEPRPWTDMPEHVHAHLVPGANRLFVCWTGALRNRAELRNMLYEWCIGTTFTLVSGNDFVPKIVKNRHSFLNLMSRRGIRWTASSS